MDKYQLAQYLINLHNLLIAQEAAGGNLKSQTLITEYEAGWGKLKEMINAEQKREASKDDGSRGTQSAVRQEGGNPTKGSEGIQPSRSSEERKV